MGPPGAGKGTQAELLSDWLGVPAISSGDLFREAMEQGTALGEQAKSYVERGVYVPDEITIGMVQERLAAEDCAQGVILDGFPRTVAQAEALKEILAEMGRGIDVVALIEVPTERLIRRLSGRHSCPQCGAVYHVEFDPERVRGVCDNCGGLLRRREDDSPGLHERRINAYREQTQPVIEHYRRCGVLVEIDGDRPVEIVQADLRAAVGEAIGEEDD